MEEAPPGGCATLVVDRPVRMFPEFWLALSAKRFADTTFSGAAEGRGCSPKQTEDLPKSEWL
jgi:hypothetical protein